MPGTALATYALYMTLVFGLRSIVQRLRTGSVGFNGFDPNIGSLGWFGGILFALAFVLLPVAAILDWTQSLARIEFLNRPSARVGGVLLYGVGLAGTLAAQFRMGESWRMGVDPTEHTALVTGGTFAVVRNPIFAAMLVAMSGLSLMVPNAASTLSLLALFCAVEIQVRVVEEPYLWSTHGAEYGNYARRVGRFWPLIGRSKGASSPAGRLRSGA